MTFRNMTMVIDSLHSKPRESILEPRYCSKCGTKLTIYNLSIFCYRHRPTEYEKRTPVNQWGPE